ncbi:MAG: hypothetical protein [Bacteriophage sp.]|nr:MAG: hypothetical protein [Bacteriophage sp.]
MDIVNQSIKNFANSVSEILNVSDIIASSKAYHNAGLDEVREMMSTYNNIISSSMKSEIIDLTSAYARQMNEIIDQTSKTRLLESMSASINTLRKAIDEDLQINQLLSSNFSSLLTDIVSESSNMIYSTIEDKPADVEESQDTDFTDEEIYDSLEEQATNPKKFQERFYDWKEKKQQKYYIIFLLVMFLWDIFFQPLLQKTIGDPAVSCVVSHIQKLPDKDSEVVGYMKKGDQGIVLEDVNYYYKVSFIDEYGKQKEGFVAKQNLKKWHQ